MLGSYHELITRQH